MAHGPRYRLRLRRRREGRTDYKARLALLRSRTPRAVVRKQGRTVIVQFIDFDPSGDTVLAQANSRDLKSLGWTGHGANLPAAYLTGLLAATRAAGAGVEDAVLDLGIQVPAKGTALFAALQGILDGGLEVPHSESVLPEEDRVRGAHIGEEVASMFDSVKSKIQEGSS